MAEPTDNLSPEEIQQIETILSALNKNPLSSEDLNPMAKVLREKLGYTNPIQDLSDEDGGVSEEEDPFADTDFPEEEDPFGGETSPPTLSSSSFEEDDSIDLDELLGEDNPKPSNQPTEEEDPFSDFGGGETTEPVEQGFENEPDPFAALGEIDEAPVPLEEPSSSPEEDFAETDPFADRDSPSPVSETFADDPFGGDFGSEMPSEEADPFSGLSSSEEPEPSSEDPFASLDVAPSTDSGSEPFGDPFADMDSTTTAADSFADDPFGGDFGSPTPEANFEEEPMSSSSPSDDPFGDLGVGMEPPSFDDDFGGSSFDDLAPSIDDMPTSNLDEVDSEAPSGLEDDLLSLGSEETEEEALDAGLSDEELAIIQTELLRYPPKLRRTVIDLIVNNRIPVRNQKEVLELIKSQQKPEDIAQFLSNLLGEKVELTETSGRYAADGVPIIASRDAYTKEGAIRRRELIRKTFLSAAASILLVFGLVTLWKYVIVPYRAKAQYALGLEKIEEYANEKDAFEKKRLLADAENYFIKGEEIFPHNLEFLNLYCMAYAKAGLYEKAFEKCFGKVEPDFGYEAEDKEHKRSWGVRKEVPNLSFAKNTEWNDAGIETAGRRPLSELSFYLTSQDKVPRKVLKAGAYIASRLKYNVHDKDTYITLGKFHSFHRKDFIEVPPGSSRKKYKNDTLAMEYFKRVFTDAGDPDNIPATEGIAKIFYNRKEFGTAVKYYNDIIEKYPKDPIGHGGILSTYIEMWKRDKNPQYVLNHHRQVRNALGIEDDLSLFVLAKLASFYIDLDSEEVRIRYNINPEDQVTGMEIDDNVEYLLNIAYGKDGGSKFAEGYYQRARFYFKKEEASRALKQLELASTYDPRHYLAVLLMAEYYIKTENYTEALALLKESKDRFGNNQDRLGEREEDETLLEGNPGRIPFNTGKVYFLEAAGINKNDNIREFPGRKIYPERSIGTLSQEEKERRNGLYLARESFLSAVDLGIEKDPRLQRECYYYLGWIDYNHGDFAQSLDFWSELPEEDTYNNPNLLFGKGNAFFYTRQYNAALGNYLKLKDDYELKEQNLGRVDSENTDHREVYETLTALYNNIGAVYEKKQDTINALKYYWKAMETARKISSVSEIANSNKDLVFVRGRLDREPLLEDWLSPTLDRMDQLKK